MVRDLQYVMEIPTDDAYIDANLLLWDELEVIAAGVNWADEDSVLR